MLHTVFAPHGMCMMWNARLIWLHVLTDGLIALSYYSIPAALFIFVLKGRGVVPARPLIVLFGMFIAFCGAGHVMDIVSIWNPIYWLKGFWNLGTALTSIMTAIVLVPKVAEFIRMPETTERLRREKSLLEEEHGVLRAVLNSVSEGILLIDETGRTVALNPAAEAILGLELRVAVEEGIETRPDGRVVETFTKKVPGLGQLYVLRDITERMRSEEMRLRLEHVIGTMKQAFSIVSLEDETIQATNPSFDAMFGYERGQAAGKLAREIYAGTPEERQARFQGIREQAEASRFWEGESMCRRGDGSTFYASARVNLHIEENHRFLSFIQFDITERKRMEAESVKFQTKLLETQKLESLGVLAGGVAHDFNNLLTGIMGNTSLALDLLPPTSPVNPRLRDALKASERAADLTRQMLAYSGKGKFVMEQVDVSALVEETSALVKLSIPKTVQLRLNTPAGLPHVEADAGQVQQLIMNLVINGAEAIGENPGTVQVTTGVRHLEGDDLAAGVGGDVLEPGAYVYLEVRDTGSGMAEETKAQIFDPFFTTKFTGRGLGLAAALGIVRGHGGTIKVYSALGFGTTFKVFLPFSKAEVTEEARVEKSTDLSGSGTILVVDDEATVRRTTFNALSHYGYEVLEAENGEQAVEIFERLGSRISLVLLDMTMPVMSGEETLRRLRKMRPEVPVVLSSGFNESEAVRRFAGQGLSGFLQKPYKSSTLAKMVKSVMPDAA